MKNLPPTASRDVFRAGLQDVQKRVFPTTKNIQETKEKCKCFPTQPQNDS